MQARAVFEAAADVAKKKIKVKPEVMIPLVGFKKELDLQVEIVHRVAKEVMAEKKVKFDYMVGTMIEVPRGALTADEIAQTAEFFSFGTNDLTQTALGITYPEITEMQARAIFEAACDVIAKGGDAFPEIMIPLVGTVEELQDQVAIVRRVAKETQEKKGVQVKHLIGTMIEVPRAAVTAGRIAEAAEFFSFGTNDLTQMAFGFSRDDAGKFLPEYVERKVLAHDPFVSIDREGVGALMQWAVQKGREARPKLKVGICGEHGGDPSSVEFCHHIDLDYVSCSPFRVPIARLAAAQAAVRGKAAESDRR